MSTDEGKAARTVEWTDEAMKTPYRRQIVSLYEWSLPPEKAFGHAPVFRDYGWLLEYDGPQVMLFGSRGQGYLGVHCDAVPPHIAVSRWVLASFEDDEARAWDIDKRIDLNRVVRDAPRVLVVDFNNQKWPNAVRAWAMKPSELDQSLFGQAEWSIRGWHENIISNALFGLRCDRKEGGSANGPDESEDNDL